MIPQPQPTTTGTTTGKSKQVLSKTDRRYWKDRIFQHTRGTRSLSYTDDDYSVQIQFNGKRQRFPLGTPNASAAQEQAAKIYRSLLSCGWDETLAKFGGSKHQVKQARIVQGDSLGSLITAFRETTNARPSTLETYVRAIRGIYAEILKVEIKSKHKTKGKKKGTWIEQVDKIPISAVTPEDVTKWRKTRIAATHTESQLRAVTTTVNSKIRNAKALFSKRALRQIAKQVILPATLPFDEVALDNCTLPKYESRLDAAQLMAKAKEELRESDTPTYCALLLAIHCGLRRAEIDNLMWSSVDLATGILHVECNDFYQLKSSCSQGSIDLSEEVIAELKVLRKQGQGDFVIPSDRAPKRHSGSSWYRCDPTFVKLIAWLRNNGVRSRKPIHELRKEVGSIVARDYGIFEASRFLRHGDIRVTAGIYLDKKQKVIPKF